MNAYFAFVRKEFQEYWKSNKLTVLIIVFLALGFMNPIIARYLPELMKGALPKGVELQLQAPVVLDSWTQFFKNVSQMGLVIIVIMFSTLLSRELDRGTLQPLLARGLSRAQVIFAKFLFAACVWSIVFWLSYGVTWGYNFMFWPTSYVPRLFVAVSGVWLFGLLMIAALLLGSACMKSTAGALLCAGGIFAICMLLSIFPDTLTYNPIQLMQGNVSLLHDTVTMADFACAMGVTLALIIVMLFAAIKVFEHKNL